MTASKLGKSYSDEFPSSDNSDKSPFRSEDGNINSGQYLAEVLETAGEKAGLSLDSFHPLEHWISRRPIRALQKAGGQEQI